jgi:hypothetical protein
VLRVKIIKFVFAYTTELEDNRLLNHLAVQLVDKRLLLYECCLEVFVAGIGRSTCLGLCQFQEGFLIVLCNLRIHANSDFFGREFLALLNVCKSSNRLLCHDSHPSACHEREGEFTTAK